MFNKSIDLFEFPTNLGLRKKADEIAPGVKELPAWLKRHGFYSELNIDEIYRLTVPAYSMDFSEKTGLLNEKKVIEYAKSQSMILGKQLPKKNFKLIIGGDCSVLIGTGLALKREGAYGLFFLDGHTDYISSDLSRTGGIAGMDLAIVSGFGEETLTNISGLKPYFKEEHIFCVGNREYDNSYVAPILTTEIKYMDLAQTRSAGAEKVVDSFLKMVEEEGLEGFFIHLDVDVLNDELMPAVDSREHDGLSYEELTGLLRPLVYHPMCIGMEITILDPTLDETGEYTRRFIHFFSIL